MYTIGKVNLGIEQYGGVSKGGGGCTMLEVLEFFPDSKVPPGGNGLTARRKRKEGNFVVVRCTGGVL